MSKKWWRSKTLWTNLLFGVALIAQMQFGFIVTPVEQESAIIIVNLILRLVTKEGLFEEK